MGPCQKDGSVHGAHVQVASLFFLEWGAGGGGGEGGWGAQLTSCHPLRWIQFCNQGQLSLTLPWVWPFTLTLGHTLGN